MKNLVFFLLVFVAIGGYSQNAGSFEGKYHVTGIYVVFAPWDGYKDSIDPRTVEVVNYGDQIILRNFAGSDSVIADLNSNSFTVPSQSFGSGIFRYTVFGEGQFSNDSLFYNYFYGGGGYDATFDFNCKGPNDHYSSALDLKEEKDFLICYPNPASDILFVETSFLDSNFHEKELSLELYSMKGELIKTECLQRGVNLFTMEVGALKNGTYILLLTSGSEKYIERVIIEK